MANRFWVGDTGSWSDTAHWSASSGGGGGSSVPISSDDVIFDAASFSASSTVTVPGSNFVAPFTMGNNITFATIDQNIILTFTGTSNPLFSVYGNLTLNSQITITGTNGPILEFLGSGTNILTSNSCDLLQLYVWLYHAGTRTLKIGDTFLGEEIRIETGTLDTNDQILTFENFNIHGGTINLGSSTINLTRNVRFDNGFHITGTPTFNAGTSTIILRGNTDPLDFNGVEFECTSNITFYDFIFEGNGTIPAYINENFSSLQTLGTFHSLTIRNAPVTITFWNYDEFFVSVPIVTEQFTANGSKNKLITIRGGNTGIPSTWEISDGGLFYDVGDTFQVSGYGDVWRVTAVELIEYDIGFFANTVIAVEVVTPGEGVFTAPNFYNTSVLTGGGDDNLEIHMLTITPLQQYIQSNTEVSASYIDVRDSYALGSIPFEDCPGGVDSGNNTNWDFCLNEYLQITTLVAADLSGDIQTMNTGKSDDGTPIYYELETQELEFGNRANLKQIADKLTVFGKNTDSTQLQAQENDGDFKQIPLAMDKTVNIGKDINLEGNFFTFRWFGESDSESPVIEGLTIENINDKGITKP